MKIMNTLTGLLDYGQSYWLDNLTRKKITGGEIKERMTKQGLRGITSNPSIFNKAIAESDSYDDQIRTLVKKGNGPGQIYEILTVKDVQNACDILKPVYHKSGGIDGFVSLEVSPYLARDTKGTIEEVHRLFKEVNRPNCFIKIPGTKEGLPAIEQMVYEGIPINITLLFSVERYAEIAKAYIHALERRSAEGKPVNNVISVASFFLSRIDVLTDQLLGSHIIPESGLRGDTFLLPASLLGKAGIASARMAYQRFREIFSSPSWQPLEKEGAHVQRPLWASTGNKDPLYDDLRYVESLIGPDTVNTLPDETIEALADHGQLRKNTIEEGLEEARQLFGRLKEFDIDIEVVTQQLENEGIRKFIEAYNKLLTDLAKKRADILKKRDSIQQISYGDLKGEVNASYASLDEKQAGRRLFARDPTLWTDEPGEAEVINKRLDWIALVDKSLLLPIALMGIDIKALLQNARQMKNSCDPYIPAAANPGISLGCFLGIARRHRRDKVTFVLSPSIRAFGHWVEQLLTESTGKQGRGLVPVKREQLGSPAVYGNDRIFVHIYLASDNNTAQDKKLSALEKAGHPVVRIGLPDKTALGGEYYRWQIAAAIAGFVMGINPFDKISNIRKKKWK
jgi:transaldolase